jgi:hypothetical protein
MTLKQAKEAVEGVSPEARAHALARVLYVMYADGVDTQWDANTLARVAEQLDAVGLVPKGGR